MSATKWKNDGVRIVRAESLNAARGGPSGRGLATAVDFAGSDGSKTWLGTISLRPAAKTGIHHHGQTEVAIFVVKGRGQIRWGERLEFAGRVGPGDFVYFAPYVPHQEQNLDPNETFDIVSVRSNNEGIRIDLDVEPVEEPETIF
jgi:uncharacterized RmlC-like cupin family protein